MKTQKDTTYGTVISFRLPNSLVRRLGSKARSSSKLDGIETANQFARKLTIDGLCRSGRALVSQRG